MWMSYPLNPTHVPDPVLEHEFKFRVSTYNIRALTYNIKEFL